MTTYYISTGGLDSNSGSIGSPWASIQHALTAISGGDTVYYRAGTYDEYIHAAYTVPSGSAGFPTIIAGYPGETVIWRPTDPNSRIITVGEGNACSYVTFRNLVFDGINEHGPFSDGVELNVLAHHIILEDFEIKNTWHSGIHPDTNDCIMRRGVIHNTGRGDTPTSATSHGVYCTGPNNLFENLEFYDCTGGYGIQIQYGTANFNTVNACVIHDCGGGLVLSGDHAPGQGAGHDNLVTNTICYSNGSGIGCGGGGDEVVRNNRVYNNVCYSNTVFGFRTGLAEDCIITNNLAFNNNSQDYLNSSGGLFATLTFQTNNWTASGGGSDSANYDPNFVNAAGADFKLQTGSAAIGAGSDLSATFTTDFDGATRTAPWDIGAYIFGEEEPPEPSTGAVRSYTIIIS